MKKLIVLIFLIIIFYGEFEYVDMTSYETTSKEVEVKGEVKKPGVYQVDRHANVKEILAKAGGVNKKADTSDINMSLDVANQSVIVVKAKQEKKLVSINTATLEELDELEGIGPSIAQRIIDYRQQHPFRQLEELKNIKGIKEKLYAKIKDAITL